MNKQTIMIASLVGIVFLVIAFVGFGPAFATQLRACQGSSNLVSCLTSANNSVTLGFVLYLIGAVVALFGWLMGLIQTLRMGRRGWFVGVFFTFVLGSLYYSIAGPTTLAKA